MLGVSAAVPSTVTADDIRFNMQEQLFIKDPVPGLLPGWYGLADGLAAADAGDASALSTPVATGPSDLGIAGLVIACLEFAGRTTTWPQQFTKQILGRVVAPQLLGASQTWTVQSGCIGWPVPMTNPPHAMRVRGAPPILLVNSTYDPSDSYVWAAGVARQVPGGVLLTRAGDGHTSYFKAGRTRDAMMRYLITPSHPSPQHGLRGLTGRRVRSVSAPQARAHANEPLACSPEPLDALGALEARGPSLAPRAGGDRLEGAPGSSSRGAYRLELRQFAGSVLPLRVATPRGRREESP